MGFVLQVSIFFFFFIQKIITIFIAKGELDESKAGWYSAVSRRAKMLGNNDNQADHSNPPTIVIETIDRNILIKEYDSMTIVLKSTKSDD